MEHEVGSGETQSAEAFLERLGMIARSSPGVRLEVDSIETLGTNLIVAVHQTQATPAHVAGLAIEPPTDGGSYDVLRTVNGNVVDRWTSGFDRLDVTTFDAAAIHTSGSIGMTPVLKRIVIPAGAQLSWKSGAQAMVFVEAGSARMTTIVSGQEATTVTLDPGMGAVDSSRRESSFARGRRGRGAGVALFGAGESSGQSLCASGKFAEHRRARHGCVRRRGRGGDASGALAGESGGGGMGPGPFRGASRAAGWKSRRPHSCATNPRCW